MWNKEKGELKHPTPQSDEAGAQTGKGRESTMPPNSTASMHLSEREFHSRA